MENASKALIIAGEILIALLIITVIVWGYGNIRDLQNQSKTDEEIEQLAVFNKEYESYNKKLIRGVEVISLMNKAINNNAKYENEGYYKIQIEFELKEEIRSSSVHLRTGVVYNIQNYINTIKNDLEPEIGSFIQLKRRIFDCVKIEYNNDSGRVNYMKFVERKVT